MCGFLFTIGKKEEIKKNSDLFKKSTELLRHRGPDFEKLITGDNFMQYHARLSIVDLSDRANQPFQSSDKRYSLLYNGEIYNYLSLKNELKNSYNFKTSSDTEVVLASFIRWGSDCVSHLDGMFSFVIFDHLTNKVFFARDRFGQKPLYYFINNKKNIFFVSSEIKPLLKLSGSSKFENSEIKQYLISNIYGQNESTFFKSIKQLKPGSYGTYENGKINTYLYSYNESFEKYDFFKFNKEELILILKESIDRHLMGDVNVGLAISSGLDSLTLLGLIKKSNKSEKLKKCFSIDFGKKFSEFEDAKKSVLKLGMKTYKVEYSIDDMVNDFEKLVLSNEAPIGGLMHLGISKVCKVAKDLKIKVLFNGSGLDEVLLGYESSKISLKDKKNNIQKKIRFIDGSETNVLNNLNKEIFYNDDNLSNSLILDLLLKSKLPKNLHMLDRASMAHSVEMRSPFVDNKLSHYCLELSKNNYFNNKLTKLPLRKAISDIYPGFNWNVKKKNLNTPQNKWMLEKKGKEFFGDILNSKNKFDNELYIKKNILKSWDMFNKKKLKNAFPIWQYVNIYFINKLKSKDN
tara:strand:+ start:1131 stop:2852 length:1722 start_codon:yes stop_codon:yes gene_type:complete